MAVIEHTEFIQGSDAWLEFRKDKITATGAYKILQGESIEDILVEKENEPSFAGNKYTERGHILEDQARKLFADLHPNKKVYEVGAITNTDYPLFASSPDALIDDDGGAEIKAFTEERQEDVFENQDPKIIAQIMFNLFLSERKYWVLIQYNPEVEDINKAYHETTFYPDEEIFAKFRQALVQTVDDCEVQEKALQIINLETELQQVPEEIKIQILDYQAKRAKIQELKDWLKTNSQGKIKKVYEDDSGNKLDISIYDTNRVSVSDESQVPEEYTTTIQVDNVFQSENGKFYQRIPNAKLAGNMYKAGKSLPPGFKVSTSRSISIKFNGETL